MNGIISLSFIVRITALDEPIIISPSIDPILSTGLSAHIDVTAITIRSVSPQPPTQDLWTFLPRAYSTTHCQGQRSGGRAVGRSGGRAAGRPAAGERALSVCFSPRVVSGCQPPCGV